MIRFSREITCKETSPSARLKLKGVIPQGKKIKSRVYLGRELLVSFNASLSPLASLF